MNKDWDTRYRDGEPYQATCRFSEGCFLVVHRHRDYPNDQWLYTCHSIGIELQEVGPRGLDIDQAKGLALKHLSSYLARLVSDLGKVLL